MKELGCLDDFIRKKLSWLDKFKKKRPFHQRNCVGSMISSKTSVALMILSTKLIFVDDFLKNPSCKDHFINKLRRMDDFISELSCNDDFMNKLNRIDDFINKTKLPRLFHGKIGRIIISSTELSCHDYIMKKLSLLDYLMKKLRRIDNFINKTKSGL